MQQAIQQTRINQLSRIQVQQQRHSRTTKKQTLSESNIPSSTSKQQGSMSVSQGMNDFQAKLKAESARVIEWQTQKDSQCKEMEKRVQQLEELVERQRKNLLEQQKNCEQVSQQCANEIKQQEELETKIHNTRKTCETLQEYLQNLSISFQSFMKIRDYLVHTNQMIMENYGTCTEKFENLHDRHVEIIDNYKKSLMDVREKHVDDASRWKAARSAFEQKMRDTEEKLHGLERELKEKDIHLGCVKMQLQQIKEAKDKIIGELTSKIDSVKTAVMETENEKNNLKDEKHKLLNISDAFQKMQASHKELLSRIKEVTDDLSTSTDNLSQIQAAHHEKNELLSKTLSEVKDLNQKMKNETSCLDVLRQQLQEESSSRKVLEEEVMKCNTLLEEKTKELELLRGNDEAEILKLNELLCNKDMVLNHLSVQLEECKENYNNLDQQKQQYLKQLEDIQKENEVMEERLSGISEECNNLEEIIHEFQHSKEKLELLSQSATKDSNDVDELINKLEIKCNDMEQELKNKEAECNSKIKDMQSCMEEYKQSYVSRLTTNEEENKKATERVARFEKDNNQLATEKVKLQEKVAHSEETVNKHDSEIQLLEKEINQLKEELRDIKDKQAKKAREPASVSSEEMKKKTGKVPESPRKIPGSQRHFSQKPVTYDDWSETSDDSFLDVTFSKGLASRSFYSQHTGYKEGFTKAEVHAENDQQERCSNIFSALQS
ncbi:uncharacterized protein LOC126281196 [Schistocerca gregaria]|uniref:uncharacterized protein LOC126281196 n=1 Tax=Schistocerca gregaria TaxID=7010 RepID=UPI00211F0426|nr:uncharacterized protein LOC126281196 [Schistocerca gregaria]XP_049835863.1 uncharacterized protein LOC126281196 [Schistocerca gregaria]